MGTSIMIVYADNQGYWRRAGGLGLFARVKPSLRTSILLKSFHFQNQ